MKAMVFDTHSGKGRTQFTVYFIPQEISWTIPEIENIS